jgi:hypothetical protein
MLLAVYRYRREETIIEYRGPPGMFSNEKYPNEPVVVVVRTPFESAIETDALRSPRPLGVSTRPSTVTKYGVGLGEGVGVGVGLGVTLGAGVGVGEDKLSSEAVADKPTPIAS